MSGSTTTTPSRRALRRKRLFALVLLTVGGMLLVLTVYDTYLRPLARLVAPFGILYGLLGLLWPRAMVDPITESTQLSHSEIAPRVMPSDADRHATMFGCGVGLLALLIGLAWLVIGIVQWLSRSE